MINKNIILYKNLIYYEKLNNLYIYNKNNISINKLTISLKLPSEIKYSNGFITMLILIEKYTNNLPMFLKDFNTLSKSRSIKIGLTMSLNGELMEKYMQLCMLHSVPKINKEEITFKITTKNYNIFYNTNIILSNTIFSFDIEIFQYYNYLNELPYYFEFIFYVNTRNILINKFILSEYNMNIIMEDNEVINEMLITTENNVMLEFGDEEYTDENEIEEDFEYIDEIEEDFEYIDEIEENFEYIDDIMNSEKFNDIEVLENIKNNINVSNQYYFYDENSMNLINIQENIYEEDDNQINQINLLKYSEMYKKDEYILEHILKHK